MILRFVADIPGQMQVLTQRGIAKGVLTLLNDHWFFEPEECLLTSYELDQITKKLESLNKPPDSRESLHAT